VLTREEIFKKVRLVVSDQLGVSEEEVKLETLFNEELDADSIDMVELTMCFEEEYELVIVEDDTAKFKTVQDAVEYLFTHQHED
jgi:acyl carrier protein